MPDCSNSNAHNPRKSLNSMLITLAQSILRFSFNFQLINDHIFLNNLIQTHP